MKIILSHKTQLNNFTKVKMSLEQFNFVPVKRQPTPHPPLKPKHTKESHTHTPPNKQSFLRLEHEQIISENILFATAQSWYA